MERDSGLPVESQGIQVSHWRALLADESILPPPGDGTDAQQRMAAQQHLVSSGAWEECIHSRLEPQDSGAVFPTGGEKGPGPYIAFQRELLTA